MFGLSFLFGAALLALPLAGLPVLLHMLYRRKSPVVLFPTLRFIKSSLQQTAARRRIQRWVLLAIRMLLLALLIWAVAQPQRTPAGQAGGASGPTLAVIVVDTGYSMLLKEEQLTLLDKANDIVGDLLREPLKDAKVAVFRSLPADDEQRTRSASAILAGWAPLAAEPSPRPLSERCAEAIEFLSRQPDQNKWLVVISDLQSRKFPSPLPQVKDTRIILFDLHPTKGASHGVASINVEPRQPLPGSKPQIQFEVTGRSGGEPRFASFHMTKLDGQDAVPPLANLQANFSSGGRARVQVPSDRALPGEKWLLLTAKLEGEDDMAWDNQRSYLLEIPLGQPVTFIDASTPLDASKAIWPALDLNGGDPKVPWLLQARRARDLSGKEQAAVVMLSEWPDVARTRQLRDFASRGGNVVLLLQPGIEQSWEKLPEASRSALEEILPAAPAATLPGGGTAGSGLYVVVPPAGKAEAIVEDMLESLRREPPVIRRFVPFAPTSDPAVSTLLYLAPRNEDNRSLSYGFYYRRELGSGFVYTIASLPESRYMTPPVPWVYPMQVIKSCVRSPDQSDAQNIEVGQPAALALSAHAIGNPAGISITDPTGARYIFNPDREQGRPFTYDPAAGRLSYPNTLQPGLYSWRLPGDANPVAIANVQLPAAECELKYRPAESVLSDGPQSVIVRRQGNEPYLSRLQAEIHKVSDPVHIWTWFIGIVLVLICLEAMLASVSNLWRPLKAAA